MTEIRALQRRRLGQGLEVSAIGLGCMGMTWAYGATEADRGEAVAPIHHALDRGATLPDTTDVHESDTNAELLGNTLRGRREMVGLETNFGIASDREGGAGGGATEINVP